MDANVDLCVCCSNPFEKRGSNYLRRPVHTIIHGKTVTDVLQQYGIASRFNRYVCNGCFSLLNKTAALESAEEELESRTNQPFKRKHHSRTPVKTPRKVKKLNLRDVGTSPFGTSATLSPKRAIRGWKAEAILSVQKSRFFTALKHLMKSRAFHRAFVRFATAEVRREMQAYAMCGGRKLGQDVTAETTADFSWQSVIKDLRDNLPVLHASLTGALTTQRNETTKLSNSGGSRFGKGLPVMGMTFAQLCYNRFPVKFNFIQELCALEMWTSGCSQKLFQHFHRLGICKGLKGATASVDRFRANFDREVHAWKTDIEEREWPTKSVAGETPLPEVRTALFKNIPRDEEKADPEEDSDEGMLPMISDSTSGTATTESSEKSERTSSESVSSSEKDLGLEGSLLPEKDNKGFCLVWDNVQVKSTVRYQTSEKTNKMLLWALCFAVKNRIESPHDLSSKTKKAVEIPIQEFLPKDEDYVLLKDRMTTLVMRMLKTHLPAFGEVQVPTHIDHQFSEESKRKSRVINLGVIDANPSSTAGVISIMDQLHTYIPHDPNNKEVFVTPCHGDGLSIERMTGAKAARAASSTKAGRLEGLEPVPQEFHKQMILTQDTLGELYSPASGADRGTLFHIRNTFNHRNVKNSVAVAYNAIADLLRFTTEGLVTTLAVQMLGTDGKDDTPSDMPTDEESKQVYLKAISNRIVETVWQQVPSESVTAVIDADDVEDDDPGVFFQFCLCKEDTGEGMVVCSNHGCPKGRWFHLSCIDLTDETVPDGDWWCSDECQNTRHSPYCICKRHQPGLSLVRCKKGNDCVGGQYFHLSCLSLKKKPGKTWQCEKCKGKKGGAKAEDHVYLYTVTLLWRGLQHLARRDAIRENDGPAIISQWRLDMPDFWKNRHHKYLKLGHKTLTDTSGFQPARLQHEIIWNRTANVRGESGHNIPLDLLNEFLNKDFKENLKARKGIYTEEVVARASQFVGTLSKDLEHVFQRQISGKALLKKSGVKVDYRTDVGRFVEEFKEDQLFQVIPGREHSAFPKFKPSTDIQKPEKLKSKLKSHSLDMDIARDILP